MTHHNNNRSFRFDLALFVLALLFPLPAFATEFRTGEQVSIAADQIVNDDVYVGGGMVSSAGIINGDLYAGSGSILITGTVTGDVVVSGGNITITGDIGDDVRAAGGTIVIQGGVLGDILAGGGQIHLAGSTVGGDVALGGDQIRVDAGIFGNVRIGGGEVYLNGPIAGEVMINADSLTLGPSAVIEGTLTYTSPKEIVMEGGAMVKGEVNRKPRTDSAGNALFGTVILAKLLMMLAGGLFLALIFRRYAMEMANTAYKEPFKEMGRGLVFLIITPVVSILLLVSIIGMPLGILGFLAFIAMLLASVLLAPVLLGSLLYYWITKKANGTADEEEVRKYEINWQSVLLGVLAFFLVGFAPIIGGLAQCLFILLTLGAAINMKWRVAKEWW